MERANENAIGAGKTTEEHSNSEEIYIGGYISFSPSLSPDITFMTFLTSNQAHYFDTRMEVLKSNGASPFAEGKGRRLIHMSYVTVISSETEETVVKSMKDIQIASNLANWLKFEALIVHMPRCANLSPRFIPNYKRAIELCQPPCSIYLENVTGCPDKSKSPMDVLLSSQEDLERCGIKEGQRWAFCLDTCHLFASGQPLTTEEDAKHFIEKSNQLRVGAIHLNGSVFPFGSERDQHCRTAGHRDEIWGKDSSGLRLLMRYWIDKKVPIILERNGYNLPVDYEGEIDALIRLARS